MGRQKRNMQGSISSQRKHWRPGRFRSIQCALVKVCQRSPTTASTSHTGVCETAYDAVLYSLPIRGGQPKTISSFRAFPNGLTWSADDKKLIYSLIPLEVGSPMNSVKLLSRMGRRNSLPSQEVQCCPQFLPKGDKLAYSSLSASSNIWRRDLLHPESPAVELIPSSRAQFDAQYSPDGKRIAFASLRSGVQGVWISSDDGSNLVQISNPNYVSGSPQWSPDGNRIAFDSLPGDRWEIYVADVAERKPRKLVTNITNVARPHWSRDGKWIYFRSNEPGRMGGSIVVPPPAETPLLLCQRYRCDQSARVFGWEDSIFCEQPRQIDAEASRSAGAARYGVQGGWNAPN